MSDTKQQAKAETFLSLHTHTDLLVLPNIWNPIGARILAAKGYPAVATASAAVAESLGYADGENIKLETLLDILSRIARSVDVPVTADIEAGYADSVADLKTAITAVLDAGVVGINIEDSLGEGKMMRDMPEQCARIAAVREVAAARGVHLVINARVDNFLSGSFASAEARMEDAVTRAKAYVAAGADCIYPIGPGDRKTVSELRERIAAPLNILATPQALSLTELQSLGINRVSFGPFIFRSCLAKFVDISDGLQGLGSYDCVTENLLPGNAVSPFLIAGKE